MSNPNPGPKFLEPKRGDSYVSGDTTYVCDGENWVRVDLIRQIATMENEVIRLQEEIRNKHYVLAGLVWKYGDDDNKVTLERRVIEDMPNSGVLHEHHDQASDSIIIRFVRPEEN
jgi:hypothetical protein